MYREQRRAFSRQEGMETKNPRLRSEKIMAVYLGHKHDDLRKKKNERGLPGFNWF